MFLALLCCFFKQKTAYEMRISDWSSDVCSSDLHNTDSWGFAESFRQGLPAVRLDRVVQFGAGGAGAAVVHALVQMEAAEIAIVDVDAERARALAERMRLLSDSSIDCATDIETSLAMADGIVNKIGRAHD